MKKLLIIATIAVSQLALGMQSPSNEFITDQTPIGLKSTEGAIIEIPYKIAKLSRTLELLLEGEPVQKFAIDISLNTHDLEMVIVLLETIAAQGPVNEFYLQLLMSKENAEQVAFIAGLNTLDISMLDSAEMTALPLSTRNSRRSSRGLISPFNPSLTSEDINELILSLDLGLDLDALDSDTESEWI